MKYHILCLAVGVAPFSGQAQPFDEVDVQAESVTVIAPWLQEDGQVDSEPATGELSLSSRAEKVFDNGLRVRLNGVLRSQYDNADSPGTTRSFGTELTAPGAFSGQAGGLPSQSSGLRTRLESAYIQLDGSYGEVRLGKDRGVAARFYEGPPSAFSHARLDAPLLDPSGLGRIRTRHDITGPSVKLSYASPRLLGVRAGFSVTPDASADGLDRRIGLDRNGLDGGLDEAYEVAINASRLLSSLDLRLEGMLAWSSGAVDEPTTDLGDAYRSRMETMSTGGRIRYKDWTLGASWADSNDGLLDGDYQSWTVGLGRPAFGFDWTVGYGSAEDGRTQLESDSWRIGASREFGDSAEISIGYLHDEAGTPDSVAKSDGVVLEVTLSTEIFSISGF
ncbi:MAG: porin [Pseudomonadota bacterium]